MVTNGDVYLEPDEIQRLEEAYLGGKKAGQREVIERYKKDNPSFYKKYQTYWDDLKKEWGL